LYELKVLLKNQVQDQFGNTHFVVDGKLIASYLPNAVLRCKVNIEVDYDRAWDNIEVRHEGPVAVVYVDPIILETSLAQWLEETGLLSTFWVAGAMNGLVFFADIVPLGWRHPKMVTAQSSDVEMDDGFSDEGSLARELLLHILKEEWQTDVLSKNQAQQKQEVIDFTQMINRYLK
jgi:hypothetical protein